jgi:hypothetical protein
MRSGACRWLAVTWLAIQSIPLQACSACDECPIAAVHAAGWQSLGWRFNPCHYKHAVPVMSARSQRCMPLSDSHSLRWLGWQSLTALARRDAATPGLAQRVVMSSGACGCLTGTWLAIQSMPLQAYSACDAYPMSARCDRGNSD